jgi:hypothetical protein
MIACLYQRLTVSQWWWEEIRRQAARPAHNKGGMAWRRYLGRRRLERALRDTLLGAYAAGVARGLCGQDQEAGRRLVEKARGGDWLGGRYEPVHFDLLLKSLSVVSCWLGRLLLVCSVRADGKRMPRGSSEGF